MVKRLILLKEGIPKFIEETENGIFHTVQGIRKCDNPGWEYDFGIDPEKWIIGEGIIEIPNRNISIIVRISNEGIEAVDKIIQECVKLAGVSSCDFVGIEPQEGKFGKLISGENNIKLIEIKPRLFKKVNNPE